MTEPTTASTGAACTAQATVVTEAAPRYAKQLVSHFGHKTEIGTEAEGPRIVLSAGSCLLVAGESALQLHAAAGTAEGLERVQQVIGSHLERFGQREGLTVDWAIHPRPPAVSEPTGRRG